MRPRSEVPDTWGCRKCYRLPPWCQRCVQRKGTSSHSFLRLAFACHRLALAYSGFARNRITCLLSVKSGQTWPECASGQAEVRLVGDLLPSDQQPSQGPQLSLAPVSQPCWHVPGQMGSSVCPSPPCIVHMGPLLPSQHFAPGCSDSGLGPGPRSLYHSALWALRGHPSSQSPGCCPLAIWTLRAGTPLGVSHSLHCSPPPLAAASWWCRWKS